MDNNIYKQVFTNSGLRNQIYQEVRNANTRTYNYKHCYNVGWLIKYKYFELLRVKLKNNEYLFYDIESYSSIVDIVDLELFIQCYSRMLEHFIYLAPPDNQNDRIMIRGAKNKNWEALKYLVQTHKIKYNIHVLSEACQQGNLEICKHIYENSKNSLKAEQRLFNCAIFSKKLSVVEWVFKSFKSEFSKLDTKTTESILFVAVSCGDVGIFKIVREYLENSIPLFSVRKKSVYSSMTLWQMHYNAMGHHERLMFICQEFDVKYTFKNFPKSIPHPLYGAVSHGSEETIKYLLDNKKITLDNLGNIAHTIVNQQRFHTYEIIRNYFSLPVTYIQIEIETIRDIFTQLETVKYLVETLNITYFSEHELSKISSVSIFKYLYEHPSGQFTQQLEQRSFIILLFCFMIRNTNVDLLDYICQKGLLSRTHFALEAVSSGGMAADVNSHSFNIWKPLLDLHTDDCRIVEFLNLLFSRVMFPDNLSSSLALRLLEHHSGTHNLEAFKILFKEIHKRIDDPILYSTCFSSCAQQGRLQSLKFLYDQGLKPFKLIDVIMVSIKSNNAAVLKYLVETHYTTDIEDNTLLDKAIIANHFSCVEYILSSNILSTNQKISSHALRKLGEFGNIEMVKYIINHPKLQNCDFQPTFEASKNKGRALSLLSS